MMSAIAIIKSRYRHYFSVSEYSKIMPQVARIGDLISHGGSIIEGSPTVNANSIPVARLGDAVTCNLHGAQTITSASPTVSADGIAVARLGDSVSCGAVISSASPNVSADG